MKFKKALIISITVLLSVIIYSCESDSFFEDKLTENKTSEIIKNNGVSLNTLSIPDYEYFFKIIESSGEKRNNLLYEIIKDNSFVSYAEVYEEFLEKIDNDKLTKDQYDEILREYDDIIKIEDNAIIPRIRHIRLRDLINRNGILRVGDHVMKYTETQKYISINGSLDDIEKAILSKSHVDGVYDYTYLRLKDVQTKTLCGVSQWARYTHTNERRATISCYGYFETEPYTGYYCVTPDNPVLEYKAYAYTEGYPEKKNIWNNWVNYKTTNKLDLNYRATTFDPNADIIEVDYYKFNNYNDIGIDHQELIREGYDCTSEQANYQIQFRGMYPNKYQTRGIDDNWAEINCGSR